MRKVYGLLGLLGGGIVVHIIFFPVFADDGIHSGPAQCMSQVKQLALGVVLYAQDHDDRFPLRDAWMEANHRYLKDDAILVCPEARQGAYGYAFNATLSSAKTPDAPPQVILLYDSINPIRNASDRVQSLPSPGRHKGRNTIAYADGHAKNVSRE